MLERGKGNARASVIEVLADDTGCLAREVKEFYSPQCCIRRVCRKNTKSLTFCLKPPKFQYQRGVQSYGTSTTGTGSIAIQ